MGSLVDGLPFVESPAGSPPYADNPAGSLPFADSRDDDLPFADNRVGTLPFADIPAGILPFVDTLVGSLVVQNCRQKIVFLSFIPASLRLHGSVCQTVRKSLDKSPILKDTHQK